MYVFARHVAYRSSLLESLAIEYLSIPSSILEKSDTVENDNIEFRNYIGLSLIELFVHHLVGVDHNYLSIRTFMAITGERDAAIRERNLALDERKRAFAESDLAMLLWDAALAEHNSVMKERDEAISTLRFRVMKERDEAISTLRFRDMSFVINIVLSSERSCRVLYSNTKSNFREAAIKGTTRTLTSSNGMCVCYKCIDLLKDEDSTYKHPPTGFELFLHT
ncbi:basic pentacysteine6-like protein [Tanacetum coccineum]